MRLYDQVSSQLDIWEAARQEEEDSNWLQVVSRAEQVRQSQHSNLQSQQFNPATATRRPSAVAKQELSVQKLHMTRLTGLQSTEQLSVSTSATSLPGASAASRLSDDDEKGSEKEFHRRRSVDQAASDAASFLEAQRDAARQRVAAATAGEAPVVGNVALLTGSPKGTHIAGLSQRADVVPTRSVRMDIEQSIKGTESLRAVATAHSVMSNTTSSSLSNTPMNGTPRRSMSGTPMSDTPRSSLSSAGLMMPGRFVTV